MAYSVSRETRCQKIFGSGLPLPKILARGRQCESEVSILCGVCKIFEVQFRT